MNINKPLVHIGNYTVKSRIYQVYRNSDGILELYRTKGMECYPGSIILGSNIERIVTNVSHKSDLPEFFAIEENTSKSYNPYVDVKQLRIE